MLQICTDVRILVHPELDSSSNVRSLVNAFVWEGAVADCTIDASGTFCRHFNFLFLTLVSEQTSTTFKSTVQ